MVENIKALKDYGLLAVGVFVVMWQNSRITEIERRLFDCLDARIHKVWNISDEQQQPDRIRMCAIMPEQIKIKNENKK